MIQYEYEKFSNYTFNIFTEKIDDIAWLNELGLEGWLLIGELEIIEDLEMHSRTCSGLFVRIIETE